MKIFCYLVKGVTAGTLGWMHSTLTSWESDWHQLIVSVPVSLFLHKGLVITHMFWLGQLERKRKCQNQVQQWEPGVRVENEDPMSFLNAEAKNTENEKVGYRLTAYSQPLEMSEARVQAGHMPFSQASFLPCPQPKSLHPCAQLVHTGGIWLITGAVLIEQLLGLAQGVVPGLDSHPNEPISTY